MKVALLLSLLFLGLVISNKTIVSFPTEDDVLVLTDETIDEALKTYDTVVIEFYATWCPHCQHLTPEYSKAASMLVKEKIPIKLAKVDIIVNEKAAKQFGVQGIPVLKFISKGQDEPFRGGRTAELIFKWIQMRLTTAVAPLTTVDQVKEYEKNPKTSLVYFGSNKEDLAVLNEYALADTEHEYAIYEKKDHGYKIKPNTLVLFKSFDEKVVPLEEKITQEAINNLIANNKYPIIIDNVDTAIEFLSETKKSSLFLIRDAANTKYDKIFNKAALKVKKSIQSIICNLKGEGEERIINYFKVDTTKTPMVLIAEHGKRQMNTFNITVNITEESIEKFVEDYSNGKMKTEPMSEEIPTEQPNAVYKLVLKSFQKEVLDNDKDVLVKFYQPWCGHCKKLAPIYEELATKLKAFNPKLIIADYDMSVNDFELTPINGYPTLLFYPGNNKKAQPKVYDKERTLKDFEEYLVKEATHPVTIPKSEL